MRKENKQIEDEKDTLVVNIANNNKKIVECEDQILDLLFNTTGSLLDDENLVLAL